VTQPTVEVEIEDDAWTRALPDAEAVVRNAAQAALTHISAHPGGSRDPGLSREAGGMSGSLVTVLLADDAAVQDLNARFRGKDAPTNVLSFPAAESARPHLGDIALAYGVCAAEAGAQNKSLSDHLAHLTVHGLLHLLGYDHEADSAAEVMEDMERSILTPLGVRDPYAWDADA
jgi:probable rRNA maturation factor